jgi:hypothetical protein
MGSSIKNQFADGALQFDKFGLITGTSSTGIRMTNDPCAMLRFKADPGNIGVFLIGEAGSGLTSFPLSAGDDTGWVSTSNVNRYQHSNISGSADYLLYWLQK